MSDLSQLLTVIVTTSAIPSHPSTRMIERCIGSFKFMAGLSGARWLVVCDDSPGEAYSEYKRSLRQMARTLELSRNSTSGDCGRLPSMMRAVLEHVKTPLVFILQHDFDVIREVDGERLTHLILQWPQTLKHVHLNKRPNVVSNWDKILEPCEVGGVPMLKTTNWSDNPHWARADYYRSFVLPRCQPDISCELLYHHFQKDIELIGFQKAHPLYGTYIPGNLDDPPTIRHLDGDTFQL